MNSVESVEDIVDMQEEVKSPPPTGESLFT